MYSKLEHNIHLPYSGKNILYPSLAVTAVDDETYFHTFPLCVCIIIQNYSPGVIPVPQSSLVGHCANVLIITKPDVFLFYFLYLLSYPQKFDLIQLYIIIYYVFFLIISIHVYMNTFILRLGLDLVLTEPDCIFRGIFLVW